MIASFQRGRGFLEEFCTIETGEGGCSPLPVGPTPMAISPRSTAWGYAEKGWFPDLLPRMRLSTGFAPSVL